jgi:hypothetical protein
MLIIGDASVVYFGEDVLLHFGDLPGGVKLGSEPLV